MERISNNSIYYKHTHIHSNAYMYIHKNKNRDTQQNERDTWGKGSEGDKENGRQTDTDRQEDTQTHREIDLRPHHISQPQSSTQPNTCMHRKKIYIQFTMHVLTTSTTEHIRQTGYRLFY